jgi:hypothetical protein
MGIPWWGAVVMGYPIFCGSRWRKGVPPNDMPYWFPNHSGLWFRIFGYGLDISTQKREYALFSERYGLTRVLYLFGWRVEALKP